MNSSFWPQRTSDGAACILHLNWGVAPWQGPVLKSGRKWKILEAGQLPNIAFTRLSSKHVLFLFLSLRWSAAYFANVCSALKGDVNKSKVKCNCNWWLCPLPGAKHLTWEVTSFFRLRCSPAIPNGDLATWSRESRQNVSLSFVFYFV